MSLFCWTQRKIFWRKFVIRLFWGTIHFHSREKEHTIEVNSAPELLCFPHSSKYLPLCSAEQRHSYRFGTTWGWVNDDRINIFGWSIPLSHKLHAFTFTRMFIAPLNQTHERLKYINSRNMPKKGWISNERQHETRIKESYCLGHTCDGNMMAWENLHLVFIRQLSSIHSAGKQEHLAG